MAYGSPVNPVAGTVITVGYAVSNILDPIRWLRLMTGNADPPGSSYAVVSTSVSATAWSKIATDVLVDGAVTTAKILDGNVTAAKLAAGVAIANLGYTPVNRTGDTMSGSLGFSADLTGMSWSGGGGVVRQVSPERVLIIAAGDRLDVVNEAASTTLLQVTPSVFAYNGTTIMLAASPHFTGDMTANDAGAGYVLQGGSSFREFASPTRAVLVAAGDRLDIYDHSVANLLLRVDGTLFQYKGTDVSLSTHTHPAYLLAASPHFTGDITATTAGGGLVLNGASAMREFTSPARLALICQGNRLSVYDSGVATEMLRVDTTTFTYNGQGVIHSGNIGTQNVASVGGLTPTATPGPNRIPISDATGTLNSWVIGPTVGTPTGLIAGWDGTAATIPTGWARYTAADGRLLIGDGVTFSQTFTTQTSYGAAWTHQHAATGLTFSGTGGTTGDGSNAQNQVNVTTPNPAFSLGTHTHSFTPAGTIGGADALTTWLPPMRAVVWIRRG